MSDGFCDVSIGEYDGDPAEFFREAVVTARKPHKCFECGATIAPGERHEYVSGKWEGKWDSYRFCLPCSEISNEFSDGGRQFGSMWDDLEMNWDEGAHLQACLNRLTTARAKEHMRQRWAKWKGLES